MITWITPEGNIGSFPEQEAISYAFLATSDVPTNQITYVLRAGVLPQGSPQPLYINPYTGEIVGSPAPTSFDYTGGQFVVQAIEKNENGVQLNALNRTFTMSVTTQGPEWVTPSNVGGYIEEQPFSYQFTATPSKLNNTIQYILISGVLPTGTIDNPFRLSTAGVMTGLPSTVNVDEESTFTIRAIEYNGSTPTGYFADKTFTITISGITPPRFDTPSGLIASIQDSVYFQYQIQYTIFDPDTTGTISLAQGTLPLGIEMSSTGLLTGYAIRPVDVDGNPIIQTYNFTLQLTSPSGVIFNDYSISVTNQDVNDVVVAIASGPSGITNASPAVVTTTTPHGIIQSQQVEFSGVTGMFTTTSFGIQESVLNGQTFYVSVINDTTFAIYRNSALTDPIDTRSVTKYGGSGNVTLLAIRKPVLLNSQPLTTNIPYTEPNSPFYITGNQIGNVAQDSKFGFKFLGHDFDGRRLVYISNQTPAIGLIPDENTGWILGRVPHVGGIVETYSFNVQVAWESNPDVISNQYRFTLQVFGDVDSNTSWVTNGDLGTIYNTTISTLSVNALADANSQLSYRLVGYQTSADLASITPFRINSIPAISGLVSVGTFGSYVSSVSSIQEVGTDWSENPALTAGNLSTIYSAFSSSQTNPTYLIAAGTNNGTPLLQTSLDGVNWNTVQVNPPTGVRLVGGWNDITQLGTTQQYPTLLGDNGGIYIAQGTDIIETSTNWTLQTSGNIANVRVPLNSVADNAPSTGSPICVVVGNNGTILTAPEIAGTSWTWTSRNVAGISVNLNSVTWTGSRFVAVGETGHFVYSSDGITWSLGQAPTLSNLNFVYTKPMVQRFLENVQIVGDAGEFTCTTVPADAPLSIGDTVQINGTPTVGPTYGTIAGYTGGTVYKITATNGRNSFTLGTNTNNPAALVTTSGLTTGLTFRHDELRYIFAGGDDGTLIRSTDGINWTDTNQQLTQNNFSNMVYYRYNDQNKFYYVVGEGGTILKGELIYLPNGHVNWSWTSPTLGSLPSNLYLGRSGNIIGRVSYERPEIDGTSTPWPDTGQRFNFRVQAYDQNVSEIVAERDFSLTVKPYFRNPYQNLYMQAYPSIEDRAVLSTLTSDTALIPPQYLYRPDDSYFGIQQNVIYQHLYGVSRNMVTSYLDSIYENFNRRQITLGELKYAVARDSSGTPIYEAVYSSIIDDLVNSQGVSIPKQITWPRSIPQPAGPWYTSTTQILDSFTFYDPYPAYGAIQSYVNGATSTTFTLSTVDGIEPYFELTAAGVTNKSNGTPPVVTSVDPVNRTVTVDTVQGNNLAVGQLIFFNNPVYTSLTNDPYAVTQLYPASLTNMRIQIAQELGQINDSNALPLWMTSTQPNGIVLGYTPAWVICYVKPGFAQTVINNINNQWQYKLNQINFRVDRFEVDNSVCATPATTSNANDWYIIFNQKNILPNSVT